MFNDEDRHNPDILYLFELCNCVDNVNMPEKRCPTAVAVELYAVKHVFFVFALSCLFNIFFPVLGDWLAAAPAAYWNYHIIKKKGWLFKPCSCYRSEEH